jgi:HEAT repeat protein
MSGAASLPPLVEPATEPDAGERSAVQELIRDFGRSLRLHLLYEGNNAALDRFVEQVRGRLAKLWATLPHLTVQVRENEMVWEGEPVYRGETRSDDLAFLFYRDGIRQLTLLPGFEEAELVTFLEILARVQRLKEEEDDLLTLLWDRDWAHLRYRYVENLPEGVGLPSAADSPPPRAIPGPQKEERAVVSTVSREDFQEALYFLDEGELRRLAAELRREMERDLWKDALSALCDRLEDSPPQRQETVIGILADLLPTLLGAERLETAGALLGDLVSVATRPGVLPPQVLRRVRDLFERLARPEPVEELIRTVEETGSPEAERGLATLLGYLPPPALPALLRAGESARTEGVRQAIAAATDRLGGADGARAVPLLADPDVRVATGAARVIGRRRIAAAAGEVARLLSRPEPELRLAAVEALLAIRNSVAAAALERALDDSVREVRMAAARALGTLRYAPAAKVLEAALESKRLREVDVTEQIAFFEAYGSVAGEAGVALLDRILNGKSWLGRREVPEIRACAALALGRISSPAARASLTAAAADAEPVVRSAVGRAVRGAAS